FKNYPEMLLYIIDYRVYNMIITFLMVSIIAIYLFRSIILYKYWQKTTSKKLLKLIFILIPFLDMLFLNIYSINDINEKPFKDRKWKFKWILILLAVVISISLILTFIEITPYNLKPWDSIDPETYKWTSGWYDLELNKFIPNEKHDEINIKTILAISGYISFAASWSLIYMSIFSLLKSEFKLSTLNQTNK
ncbi:hypothetical protein, partial [Mycoplasmopsis pullorum]|uniref:hypothetical protein n=1 Tax=Mycoplasmopsis pullorum TaxID=48003 RepID=UPI001C570D7D